jgi:hypothetical protein
LGCDGDRSADSLACGNGSERTPHPIELFGDDWNLWGLAFPCVPARPGDSQPLFQAESQPTF